MTIDRRPSYICLAEHCMIVQQSTISYCARYIGWESHHSSITLCISFAILACVARMAKESCVNICFSFVVMSEVQRCSAVQTPALCRVHANTDQVSMCYTASLPCLLLAFQVNLERLQHCCSCNSDCQPCLADLQILTVSSFLNTSDNFLQA